VLGLTYLIAVQNDLPFGETKSVLPFPIHDAYEGTGVADRGDGALALVETTLPDLVLMDIRLKGQMDGIAAAEEIRRRWRIPVVYLTAFSEDHTLQRAKVTEPFGYIIKPFEDREIQAAIEMALYKHQAEQRLRESEERLRLALLAANQGLYDLNVQAGEAVVSPEYARMLGFDPDSFRETNAAWRDRLHPEDREEVYRVYQEYIEGRRNDYRVEFRQRTSSGDWQWILSLGRIVEYDKDGNPLRMLGRHTDITERKRIEADRLEMERRLLHAQKLESLGVLAGGIAHDFNNLLMAILGYADLALLEVSLVSPARRAFKRSSTPPTAPPTSAARCWPTRARGNSWSSGCIWVKWSTRCSTCSRPAFPRRCCST
jgi:PAS domain S-box-containing protein